MKITRIIAIAVIAGSLGVGALDAQIRDQTPAEFPPASYQGKQYVDSKGCVFIRAGIDGNVTWVPRVTRARQTVCGFKPTLAGQVASAAPAPAPSTSAEAPVQITLDEPAKPAAAAPVARPAPRPAVQPRPAPAPVVVRQTAPKPAAPRVVRKPVAVAAAPAPAPAAPKVRRVKRQVTTSCPGASPISQRYLRGNGKLAVRCGPQAEPIIAPRVAAGTGRVVASTGRGHAGAPASEVTAQTRIVPKHVAYNRINTRDVTVPEGYRKVWEDDRLNPYRAEQNLEGRNQMALIWTNTVPRRLIDARTGRDVTASVPLIYPYIDTVTQSRNLGEVTIVQRDGKVMKRIVRNPNAARAVRQPTYSTRSAPADVQPKPAAAAPRALAGKSFVQIGAFRNPGNAQRAAQKVARMGMPARIGKHSKGGQTYLTVQAGPFQGASAMQNAMSRLRGAGYTDAFARN